MDKDKEMHDLLIKKGLHIHNLEDEDYADVYDNYRKFSGPLMRCPLTDTHYIMNKQGQVVFIGNKEGVMSYAFRG